ncbi:SDR family NAD(P)-dependent oxidoreductase [Bowmanella pacifica]|uniref:Oxidoreductase DltE n=1 Tax=Bowmanella pacifica TaxID=502051 RepID=A0A918DM18_9ALTE|nr:SDR family NAD(P)-dependent oxidoreductase [Bowmanella pacifica]GGO74696.1 putative oxidoreductase DltE [Bowmanella pacifica]
MLSNKTLLITGATSGIGYELVRQLAPHNHILAIARDEAKLVALTQRFAGIQTYSADLSDQQVFPSLCQSILSDYPKIDVLINNAAVQFTPRLLDDDFCYASIAQEVTLNFTAVCALSYLLLPALLQSGKPSYILNINSGLALAPKTQSAVYCASKAALNSFSQSLGYQLEHTQVSVLQAFLPLVDTPMTQGRGNNKLSVQQAAQAIIHGLELGKRQHDIGKVKLLRLLLRIAPALARHLMKGH